MLRIVVYKPTRIILTFAFACVLLTLLAMFIGTKQVGAIGANFPRGVYNTDEWVLLSQYECPGHCLQTPKADIRIFYKQATMDNQSIGAGYNLGVRVQTLCRYVGTPNAQANMENGTNRPNWPNITCTGLNTHTGGSDISTFSVERRDLDCTQSGAGQKYPGWCFSDLHFVLNRDSGSDQPLLGIWITANDSFAKVTAAEDTNPDTGYTNSNCWTGAAGNCGPVVNNVPGNNRNVIALWNNYNSNGAGTKNDWEMTFKPDCTVTSNQPAYLRWYDGDDPGDGGSNGTQDNSSGGQLNFRLLENGTEIKRRDPGQLGGNDSYRDLRFTVKPGKTYRWRWNNVSATNGIQIWMPFSENNVNVDCDDGGGECGDPGEPACPTNGSMCTVISVANAHPYVGQSTTITVQFTNTSNNYDWYVGSDATPPPSGYTRAKPGPGSWIYAYPTGVANDVDSDGDPITFNKRHLGVLLDNGSGSGGEGHPLNENGTSFSNRLRQGESTNRTFTIYNNNPGSPRRTYSFNVWNAETGGQTAVQCTRSVTWYLPSVTASCDNIIVGNPGNVPFYLRFNRSDGAVQTTGVYSGSPAWNTFNDFTFLYPHFTYDIELVHSGTNAVMDTSSLDYCMALDCDNTISTTSGTVSEPGENTGAYFGMRLYNFTGRNFPTNLYNVRVTATPGVSIVGTDQYYRDFPVGGWHPFSGAPWTISATHQGTIQARLYFGGTEIGGDLVSSGYPCSATYRPQTRPIIQARAGDVSAGGAFKDASGQCSATAANFIAPSSKGATSGNYAGGIRTFSRPSSKTGSGTDFGAYALGLINGTNAGSSGFYSARSWLGGAARNLVFANTGTGITLDGVSGNFGGVMGGLANNTSTNAAAHCAADYFNTTRKAGVITHAPGDIDLSDASIGNNQYLVTGNVRLTASGLVNKRVTLYVDGNVQVDGNIQYDNNWTFNLANHTNTAPYVSIIARGNINVESGISRIAGLFVAQPTVAGAGGIFTSCSIGGVPATAAQIDNSCRGQLTVNGSVIAQHIYPLRAGGTLINNGPVAETANYYPSMVVGTPNLKPLDNGAEIKNSLEGLTSLPPVF